MKLLGISAFYHDSASALIENGQVVTAVEEERFSRIKHDNSFPEQAINFCLKSNNLSIDEIDCFAYYEKPLLKFERILETFVQTYPYGLKPFLKAMPEWLGDKIKVESIIRKKTGYKGKIFFVPHHYSHASAAFFSSEFEKSAILTIDGVGEYQTTGLWVGNKTEITPLQELNFPHSLGLFYSTFTAFLGFRVNHDEYKMMGLAAYGKPRYTNEIYNIMTIKKDGYFELNMNYFGFRESFQMWRKPFESVFGEPRRPDEVITQRHKDLAASIQVVTEEVYFKILNYLYSLTKTKNLCVSGGVGLNSLANGKIYLKTPFKNVSILGPAGDSGAAVGAALYAYYNISKQPRRKPVTHLYLGSFYSDQDILKIIKKNNLTYRKFKNEKELVRITSRLLSQNKVIGWFQGKMEFGPRALGARSILANPKDRMMKDRVNQIKGREEFRPFAASVLQEHVHELFEIPEKNHHSPFMNFCFQVRKGGRNKIAAVVHADNTCRIQTVNEKDNGRYYRLIKEFYKITGIPCILNTSFNLSHEPIVENPEQAVEDFLTTKMKYLVIEGFLVKKKIHKE